MDVSQPIPTLSLLEGLPSEIITACLLLAISPEDYEKGTEQIRELCCINRSFWRIIRGEPRFWNHLTIRDWGSIQLQTSHLGSCTPLYIYWRQPVFRKECQDWFALVISLAHRWISLIIDGSSYAGTFGATELYAVAPSLKYVHIVTIPARAPPPPDYPLSSQNLESLELRGPNLTYWSPISFLHLKDLILSINRTWDWVGHMLEVCPVLESLELSGGLKEEDPLDEEVPIPYIYLPELRKFSVDAFHPTLPSLVRRIVALNLEKLNMRLQLTNADDAQLYAWASFNPTLKTILLRDYDQEVGGFSVRYVSDCHTRTQTYVFEQWKDRFSLEITSRVLGWGMKFVHTLDEMGAKFTISASLPFAFHLITYPLNISSLTIEGVGKPYHFLSALATPVEGTSPNPMLEGTFPYPMLRELRLPPLNSWTSNEPGEKEKAETEIEPHLRRLWECRGPLGKAPIALDVFNFKGKSVYRHWLSTGSTGVNLDLA